MSEHLVWQKCRLPTMACLLWLIPHTRKEHGNIKPAKKFFNNWSQQKQRPGSVLYKEELRHWRFPVNFTKFQEHLFDRAPPGGCFRKAIKAMKHTKIDYLQRSLLNFIPYVLMCQSALLAYVLTCQDVLPTYVLTCQRTLRTLALTC